MRLILLFSIVLISLTACREGKAKDADVLQEKPYKATNVDECLREMECVWYHLVLAMQPDHTAKKLNRNLDVKKWVRPFNLVVLGKENPNKILNKFGIQISGVNIPYSTKAKHRFFVQYTDDIEQELQKEKYNKPFQSKGRNLVLDVYLNETKESGKKCFYFTSQSHEPSVGLDGFFAFIQNDHPNKDSCFKEAFYNGHGLTNKVSSPIWDSYKDTDQYSELEIFLLHILYLSDIQNHDSFDVVKEKFSKSYLPIFKLIYRGE